MRIGISTTMIQRGKSGVAQHVLALVRALLERNTGHTFTLFVLEEDLALFEFARGQAEIVAVPERFRGALRNIAWHQLALPKWIERRGLDVLHVPSYRRLLWRKPCRLVGTIHDLAPFHLAAKYDFLRMFYGRVVVRWLAHRQHALIAVSHQTARDLQQFFGMPRDRVQVIHNGIDHQRFYPGDSEQARSFMRQNHPIEQPYFLYIARLEHPGKNHLRLIDAFNQFKAKTGSDWQLVLGGSDWHGAEVIHREIARSPVARDIRSLGFVAQDELSALYRAAEAFVYPSLFEGFGLPPVEAMACGCPVICSGRGALTEVVGSAAVMIDPENAGDIARRLIEFSQKPDQRRELAKAGMRQAAIFRWETAACETLKVYQTVFAAVHDTSKVFTGTGNRPEFQG